MKTMGFFLLLLVCSFNGHAFSNFVENPYTPYPPGCATLPDLQTALYGENAVKVADKEITLENAFKPGTILPVNVAVFRVACAEPNRSVILVEFRIPDRLDPAVAYYLVPRVAVGYDSTYFPTGNEMQLSAEPNVWGSSDVLDSRKIFGGNTPGTTDGHDRRWVFVLDNLSSPQLNDYDSIVTPSIYNNSYLTLTIGPIGVDKRWYIEIDTTAILLDANLNVPLSGRLSGAWVVDGVADQGFVLAISEMVPDVYPEPAELIDSSLLMFLSWYTFDVDGNMLWLTGDAEFHMGDIAVTVPIVRVTNGEFMGGRKADREVVGSATITGKNCNDLSLAYTLNDIGLGSGTKRLQRIYSLETAGYTCRDLEARMATK